VWRLGPLQKLDIMCAAPSEWATRWGSPRQLGARPDVHH